MLRHCGLDEISAPISPISAPISAPISPTSPISSISGATSGAAPRAAPLRVVILLRGDTQQDASLNQTDGNERRAFASPGAVRDELLSALPPGASLHTFVTAGDAPLCEQVQWVHGASIVLSPHGAHLTNALWMARGALLLEVGLRLGLGLRTGLGLVGLVGLVGLPGLGLLTLGLVTLPTC